MSIEQKETPVSPFALVLMACLKGAGMAIEKLKTPKRGRGGGDVHVFPHKAYGRP